MNLLPASTGVEQEPLKNQADRVHLRRRTFNWQNPAAVDNLMGPLLARSFSEVADFSIAEIPELKVRLLMKSAKSIYACICEYPKHGTWLDLVSHYEDGGIAIFSTARDPGVEHSAGDLTVHAPELSADMLYTRMLKERPERTLAGVDATSVTRWFQETCRRQLEWRTKERDSAPR